MLDRPRTDVGEIVQVGVVVVDVSDGGEIQARDVILDEGEVGEVRHEAIDDRGQ